MDKRKHQWCLVYKNKYVLRVGTWRSIENEIEKCPYPYRDDYRNLHIDVCKGMISAFGVGYFCNEEDDKIT